MSNAGYDTAIGSYEALRSEACGRRAVTVPGWVMFHRGGLAAWLAAHPDRTPPPRNSAPTDAGAPIDQVRGEVARLMAEIILGHQRQEGAHGKRRVAEDHGRPSQTRRLPVHQAVYSAPGV